VLPLATPNCEMPFLHAPSLPSAFLAARPRAVCAATRPEHSKRRTAEAFGVTKLRVGVPKVLTPEGKANQTNASSIRDRAQCCFRTEQDADGDLG
jgi:hypothetical protein